MRAVEKSRRMSGRRVKTVFISVRTGEPVEAIRLNNGEMQLTTTPIPTLSETTGKVVDSLSVSTAYTAEQIRRAGGIDALSVVIGNDKPISMSATEFTEAEWAQMITDLTDDQ